MRIESREVAKRLHGNDGAGDGIVFRSCILEENLQGFPDGAAEIGKKLPIIEKVTAEDFRDTEDEMTVRDLFEDIHAEPFNRLFHFKQRVIAPEVDYEWRLRMTQSRGYFGRLFL